MVDIETLGGAPDGMILSVGAFCGDRFGGETFYANVSMDSQPGRRTDYSTFLFWMQQPDEARKALFEPEPVTIEQARADFKGWVETKGGKYPYVWANGTTFDLAILRHAGFACWGHRQEQCLRPIRLIGGRLGMKWRDFKEMAVRDGGVTLHRADHDAQVQGMYLAEVLEKVGAW